MITPKDQKKQADIVSALRQDLAGTTKALIAAAGGRERASALTGKQLSTLSNWSGGHSPIPLWAAILLCREAGWPLDRLAVSPSGTGRAGTDGSPLDLKETGFPDFHHRPEDTRGQGGGTASGGKTPPPAEVRQDVTERVLTGLDILMDDMGVTALPPRTYRRLARYVQHRVLARLSAGEDPSAITAADFRPEVALAIGKD